jgi:hypothetical protein
MLNSPWILSVDCEVDLQTEEFVEQLRHFDSQSKLQWRIFVEIHAVNFEHAASYIFST